MGKALSAIRGLEPGGLGTRQGKLAARNFTKTPRRVATPPAPYRSLPGPPGPESRKSLKRGRKAPGSKKCPKQSQTSLRSLKIDCFETPETVSRLFRTLFGPWGRKAPGDSFETLSAFRAQRARETPVRGGRGCNRRAPNKAFSLLQLWELGGLMN